ncbi:MAG TPA: Omp28-related outer membrane protein [Bacteroidia bacterium]
MNKIIKITFLLVVTIYFAACDYVSNPLLPRTIIKPNDTVVYQNILIEDYTGMTCVNCPAAAAEMDTLISLYGSRIIPLSINYGYYATPPQAAPCNGWDFTTPVGNTYGDLFITASGSFPSGMINRIHYPLGQEVMGWAQWGDTVKSIITANTGPANIKLILTTTFNASTRALTARATATFLKANTGNYNIVLLLTQDSILAPQLIINKPPNLTYAHRFVLRDNITSSAWGDVLVPIGGASLNQVFSKNYTYNIAAGYPAAPLSGYPKIACDYTKCSVVAYIYDAATTSPTYYQVMQAQQKKIYP